MTPEPPTVSTQSSEPDNWRAAHELYKQVYGEVVRYRDMEWKVSLWTLALLSATTAIKYPSAALPQCFNWMAKVAVIAFIVCVAIYGSWHLHFIHRELTGQRNSRRTLERSLGLSDATRNGGVALIPEKWSKGTVPYSKGLPHLLSWWFLIAIVAIYTSIVAAWA